VTISTLDVFGTVVLWGPGDEGALMFGQWWMFKEFRGRASIFRPEARWN
jgi:hypothetical protein